MNNQVFSEKPIRLVSVTEDGSKLFFIPEYAID